MCILPEYLASLSQVVRHTSANDIEVLQLFMRFVKCFRMQRIWQITILIPVEDITTLSIMSILDTYRVNGFSVIHWLTNSQRDKHQTEFAVFVSNVAISSPCHDGVTLSGVFVSARASRVLSKITKSDTPSAKHGIKSLLTNPSLRHFKSEQNANKSFQELTRV